MRRTEVLRHEGNLPFDAGPYVANPERCPWPNSVTLYDNRSFNLPDERDAFAIGGWNRLQERWRIFGDEGGISGLQLRCGVALRASDEVSRLWRRADLESLDRRRL